MSADGQSIKELHRGIIEGKTQEELDVLLWDAVVAYQNQPLRTLSGLEFSYTVKHKKNGEYSGELLVSRKETSKTLTRSSVMLAFHKVLEKVEVTEKDGTVLFTPPSYKGPKAIGQIFGISYIFSLFLEIGLIKTQTEISGKITKYKK
ncbi:MAG: hypothetical protein PUC51_09530 [Ruminococcus sp.]|nr:hypothetical protein [Ruminococcus sp.]